ncbi:MAG: thermonuclease family protein [Hyphomicrobiales bacterium]|nr:thermonuclease family protein [Hyphomicrobiales bacterium]
MALLLVVAAPLAARAGDALRDLGAARVVSVVDGDTVVLDRAVDGADQVRLVGIQAPKLPLGRKGFAKWPLGDESKAALEALVLDKSVKLAAGGRSMDRHGRLLAHLYLADGTWVQGRMLETGMARVYTFPDNRALAADMYAREAAARAAGRGIWALPFYAVRGPDGLAADIGTFQVVEGRVLRVAKVRNLVYVNYGRNWRDDFTLRLDSRAQRLFRDAGVDLLYLQGRVIRVRGWLRDRNGPLIDVTHPEQVEVP